MLLIVYLLAAAAVALPLLHYVYTLLRFRRSRLMGGLLPVLGHLPAFLRAKREAGGNLLTALRLLLKQSGGGVCTLCLGFRNIMLVDDEKMMRAVLSSVAFNNRPRAVKMDISSLVRRCRRALFSLAVK